MRLSAYITSHIRTLSVHQVSVRVSPKESTQRRLAKVDGVIQNNVAVLEPGQCLLSHKLIPRGIHLMSMLEQGIVKAVGHGACCTSQILPKAFAMEVVNRVPVDVEQSLCRVCSFGQHANTMCILWSCAAHILLSVA